MGEDKKISMAVIRRLPRYFRYLYDLMQLDIKRISSKELSERMHITASQIRQDLNCFGGFGQQGYGYNVEYLYNEIGKILGTDKRFNCIILGAGNMGKALASYENFRKRGFDIVAVFDVDEKKIGTKINDIEVYSTDKIPEFVAKTKVDIAILTVPNKKIIDVAKEITSLGIKAIWNFSPTDLRLGEDVVVENVHLSDSLMVLGYRLREKDY
ncbi:MAG TPA: redox-sensing transcriptional repressor Rex [Clostridiaceae bacterium]|nr:redox-sensing transcriptional repressor Rex [Clostridiaceae bacterium]